MCNMQQRTEEVEEEEESKWNTVGSRTTLYVPSTTDTLFRGGFELVVQESVVLQHPSPTNQPLIMPRPPVVKRSDSGSLADRKQRTSGGGGSGMFRPKSRTDSSCGVASLGGGARFVDSVRLRGMDGGGDGGGGGGGGSDEDLTRQNYDLRQRLQDEAALYRKRLDTYKQAQQNQAALVSRLQAKVLQYKQKCAALEAHMDHDRPIMKPMTTSSTATLVPLAAPGSALEQAQQHLREIREERISDLDVALNRLEEERQRCESLINQNKFLREQLEESHQTNEDLTSDLQKLTNQFDDLREEIVIKEDEWKDEEQAFNDYYSTEHNRLLGLWRDVVSIKRLFIDVQNTTERDLSMLKHDLEGVGRDMCNRIQIGHGMEQQRSMMVGGGGGGGTHFENIELKANLEQLRQQYALQKEELKRKDGKMEEMMRDVQLLEDKCADAEQQIAQVVKMQDEVELLQNALKDIAHALIQDVDTDLTAASTTATHLHLSTPLGQKSPKRSSARLLIGASAFAESTISAVHAALHKYQSTIHELQVKLQANREQLLHVRKQCENCDEALLQNERQKQELIGELDNSRVQTASAMQERDTLQKQVNALRADKEASDKQRVEMQSMLEHLNVEYEKLHKMNVKLMKEIDALNDEKLFMQSECDKLQQDGSLREMNLRMEEDRCSRMREELLIVKEEVNKLRLSNDLLEQQKLEGDALIGHLEKIKGDYEMQLDKAHGDRSIVHESLVKKENITVTLEMDKKRLQDELKKVEDEKHALQLQCNDHQNDIQSLRKELLQTEQMKLDLESEKVTLNERIKFIEIEKEKLDMDLGQLIRERTDLSNQLTVTARQRETINEELSRTKQKLEQSNETNARINRNLEALVNESEEKQCTLDAMDKEIQRLQEQLASVRSEKESLEAVLFDTQTNLEASDIKKQQLEQEVQELLVKQETFKGQIGRLTKDLERAEKRHLDVKNSLTQQAATHEVEFQHIVANLKKQMEENQRKLTDERETIRQTLEKRMQQSLHQLEGEKDGEIQRLVERIENLQTHIEHVCQQHEELMLRAENDKQQALLIAHHDQQALQDRCDTANRELEAEKENLERMKRETQSKFEQERAMIKQLKDELNKLKGKLDDGRNKYEEDRAKLQQRIEEVTHEKETASDELERLKVQLHLQEDKCDTLNNQLHDTIRKLKESEMGGENMRKDLTDVRRQLTDSNFEKEKYNSTNKELREIIKRVESEKRDNNRQLEEANQKVSNLEDIKSSLEHEKQHLHNQLRDIEKEQISLEHNLQTIKEELQRTQTNNTQQQAEEKELQGRLLNEIEERERSHQEVHTSKKQIAELERNLEHTRKELAHARAHSGHLQEQWHAREQDLLVHLEDSRGKEKRLEDQKHNLEVCLVDATQQIQELKTKMTASESRVKSLDAQLGHLEAMKRDVEQKLSSIVATLRRIAGIQMDGSLATSHRLLSPSRRWSPARSNLDEGQKDASMIVVDVDPEQVRKGVRNLMQQVAQVERERDDYKTQLMTFRKQLQDAHEVQTKGDSKLNKMLQNVRMLQDEKSALEAKVAQKTIALNAQNDTLAKRNDEVQMLREKITNLELNVSSCHEEKTHSEDKLEKYKNALHKLESEKRTLQDELGRCETRSAKMELQRMSAEGDLQRLQMILAEKEGQIQKLHEKCEIQGRNVASLEERCISLKTTVDQLNLSLERAASNESEMKVEVQSLQRSLLEATTSYQSGSEKLKQLQKALLSSENDRKITNERFEVTQQNLNELRRNNQLMQDQITHLNGELANNEVIKAGLESQLRLAHWPSSDSSMAGHQQHHHHHHQEEELQRQLQMVQRERTDLKTKVDSLNNKLRHMEHEKRDMERLVMEKGGGRSRSFERPEKCEYDSRIGDTSSVKYEQENRELRMKISRLESELGEKEAELMRMRIQQQCSTGDTSIATKFDRSEIERYRAAQLQAERLLEAREQSHRQQIARLESQIQSLRDQLNQETKRRQQYIMRSSRAGREMQQLRQALGDSLRTVSQDPSLDALLLEQEARKLDNTLVSSTASLPPALHYDRT